MTSYEGMHSAGENMAVIKDIKEDEFKDTHVLVVEDIFDTGNSMIKLLNLLESHKPASVRTFILLHKLNKAHLKFNYTCDYIGFLIPDKFVIGFGLDMNEYVRDIPHVCVTSEVGISRYNN